MTVIWSRIVAVQAERNAQILFSTSKYFHKYFLRSRHSLTEPQYTKGSKIRKFTLIKHC